MLRMFVRTMATASPRRPLSELPVSTSSVEGRYVYALYSAAANLNQLNEVEKSLNQLMMLLKKPKVEDFITTSLISRAGKSKLLMDIGKEVGMPSAATNFLGLVAENGRLKQLRRMITMFQIVMVVHRNEELCEVITADPLDDTTRKALIDVLKKFVKPGKNIYLREKVAADAIGGVAIGFENKHIDMTIATRLLLYRELLKINV